MSTSFESLAVLLVLLPGFLASLIYNALQERREVSGFRPFMEALAFAFVIQSLLLAFGEPLPLTPVSQDGRIVGVLLGARALATSAALAVMLPAGLSGLVERDLLLPVLRRLGVTSRTGRASAWLDAFARQRAHVTIHFHDGFRVMGWPLVYSDSPDEGMIYLQDPAWVSEDDRSHPMNVDGLFVCNRAEIRFLTFSEVRKRS